MNAKLWFVLLLLTISLQMRRGGSGRMEENGGRFGFRGGRDDESRDSGWGDESNRRANGRNNGIGGRGEGGGWGEDRRGGQEDIRRMTGDRDRLDRGGGGRDRDRDRNGRRPQREPEWMNECISKSDVIELRGFDNPAKANNNNKENKEQTNGGGGVGKPVNLGNLLPGLNSHNQPGLNRDQLEKQPHPGLPTGGELLLVFSLQPISCDIWNSSSAGLKLKFS